MDIGRAAIKILRQEAERKPFQGRALLLGEWWDPAESPLFPSLGFSSWESTADAAYLNEPITAPAMRERFDLIVDVGMVDRIFHFPNALKNIEAMLRPEGRVLHIVPSTNHTDRGFYMFSPSLFWEFYKVNQFQINSIQILRKTLRLRNPWDVYNYEIGCLGRVSFGGLDDKRYVISAIATKTPLSTGHVIPQQQEYEMGSCRTVKFQGLKRRAERFPRFYKIFKGLAKKLLMGPLGLKRTAKF